MKQIEETIQWLFENDAKEMKKICNKEIACVAFQRGDIPKKKSRDEMINNIKELVG